MSLRTAAFLCLCMLPRPAGAAAEPAAGQVARAIADRRSRVAEFQVIKAAAEELGLRVWLFGGTAAGFAHYVRWDLAREGGDPRYRQSFFDYDFTNIYRSTQDADLVVDGSPEQAEALERLIKEKMGFLQGSKDHWEVRLLREDRVAPGGQVKQALLANPDFLGQHTDSNSTGMVELTDPPSGETVVRDLRDWESGEPFFLRDVTAGRLHYYESPTHQTTTRFREGHNPPLFSVIRYLVKAFQYGLKVDGEDLKRVKAVIDAFDPARDPAEMSGWAKGWLERYGPNLIRHAVDVEYAWNTLQTLGLREKLIALSDPDREESLGWWLSKEPMRSGRVGRGRGKTARELGLTTVAHETRSFLTYEAITRNMTGLPNVLISRPGHPGETASLGPGFYTRMGTTGAKGTGFTIRFEVAPGAREGTDFRVWGDHVLVLNRAALRVIPESLNFSLPDYLELLLDEGLDPADRGLWMKLQRRLSIQPLSQEDERRAAEIISRATTRPGGPLPEPLLSDPGILPLLRGWFEDPASDRYPEVKEALFRLAAKTLRVWRSPGLSEPEAQKAHRMVKGWFSLRISTEHPELIWELLDPANQADAYFILDLVLRQRPEWARSPELLRRVMEQEGVMPDAVIAWVLKKPEWASHPELLALYLDRADPEIDHSLRNTLKSPDPTWLHSPEVVRALLEHVGWDRYQARTGRRSPHGLEEWGAQAEAALSDLAYILSLPHWKDQPELVRSLIEALPPTHSPSFGWTPENVRFLLGQPQWADHPELVLAWIERTDSSWDGEIGPLLREAPWRDDPLLRRLCGGERVETGCLRTALARSPAGDQERVERILSALPSPGMAEAGCR